MAHRIVLLTLGWEELPKSVSVYGAPADQVLREPIPGVLVESDEGWVLLDTGYNAALIRDEALRRRFFPRLEFLPILPGAGEPLDEALAVVGIGVEDIRCVAVSHLHYDHAGGIKHFAGRVPIHAQRRDLEYGLSPAGEAEGMFRIDFDDPGIDWRLADGDVDIAPGVRAIATPGHTPGHQSFVVDLDDGSGFVFAFDAADLTENIDQELPIGSFVGVTAEETLEPIRRLKELARTKGYRLIPGHDPVAWPALTAELAARQPSAR
ncbi:MAG: N-acyl homoserine lactonase family protein [Nocardioides sp.]